MVLPGGAKLRALDIRLSIAIFGPFRLPDHLRSRADRSEGILEFVRDVCRNPLEQGDLVVHTPREFLQRPGQIAKFVLADGPREGRRQRPTIGRQRRRGTSQATQRADDGHGRQRRQRSRRKDRCDDHLKNAKANVVDRLQDPEGRLRYLHGTSYRSFAADRDGAEER